MARLDGAVAVIASEATRSTGTQGSLRSLDCFVAPLLAMTIPPECAMLQPNWASPSSAIGDRSTYSDANILRMFRECRGVRAIHLHYRSIDPLKFLICSALAHAVASQRER
jgi:hypothetical protein